MKKIILACLLAPALVIAQDKKPDAPATPAAPATPTTPATPAAPGKPGKPKLTPEEQFKKLDTNSDSSLSLEEFKVGKKDAARAETMFTKKDKDKDSKLSLEEYKSGPKPGPKPAPGAPDKPGKKKEK